MVAKKHLKIKLNGWYFLFGIISTLLIIRSWQLFALDKTFQNKIYPNVYIDNQLFSGKTKENIVDSFNKKSLQLKDIYITVLLKDEPVATFSGQKLGLQYDGQTAAERAYLVGRSKYFLSRFYQKLTSLLNLGRFDFISTIDYDKTIIKEKLEEMKDNYD